MTYEELVNKRKAYKLEINGLINQSELEFDIGCYLDPWGKWHNALNADILVIGQDWGNTKYYDKNNGIDNASNPTCNNLIKLFRSIGLEIGPPNNPNKKLKLHFVNIIPFIRKGKMQGGLELILNQQTINEFADRFIKPLVDIVKPELIITLGLASTNALISIFEVRIDGKPTLTNMVNGQPLKLQNNILLLPMFHCGASVINRKRNLCQQIEDWKKVKTLII